MGNCKGKNCRKRGKKSRKERKRKEGREKIQKVQFHKSSVQKKGGKKSGKRPNPNKKKIKAGRRQNGAARSSSRSASGRNTTGDTCFADLVAKTKKFNKAQVEYRLAKRVQTWGKLMKNKKTNAASTFADALEAMNDATGNGTGCDGDSASLAEAKEVQAKLANCSVSAGDNCDEGKLATPINSTLVSSCKDTLEAF